MFIGRKQEISTLKHLYDSNKFQFAVIYGRRRIGKTALINEFFKDKKAIYFTGLEENASDSLKRFSTAIYDYILITPLRLVSPPLMKLLKRLQN